MTTRASRGKLQRDVLEVVLPRPRDDDLVAGRGFRATGGHVLGHCIETNACSCVRPSFADGWFAEARRSGPLCESPLYGRIFFVKSFTFYFGMHSTISEKGQVTVPKPLRDRLGIRPGDRLDFTEEDGHIVVSKATDKQDPIGTVYGILSLGESTDEVLRGLRGEPDAV